MKKLIAFFALILITAASLAVIPLSLAGGDAMRQASHAALQAQTAEAIERAEAARMRAEERQAVSPHLTAVKVAGVWLLGGVGFVLAVGGGIAAGTRFYQATRHNLQRAALPVAQEIASGVFVVAHGGAVWLVDEKTGAVAALGEPHGASDSRVRLTAIEGGFKAMVEAAANTKDAQAVDMVPALAQIVEGG